MNIVQNRKIFYAISIIAILIGFLFMFINVSRGIGAFNFNVEFYGGTAIEIDMGKEFENNDIAKIIEEVTGQSSPQIQKIIGTNNVNIRMLSVDQETRMELVDRLTEEFDLSENAFSKISDVSPTISHEMQRKAILAVAVASFAMLIYLSLRFELKKSTSAVIVLLHDALIVLATYAILRIPLDYYFIAALLTVLGYSINSTIVIFDRVRENKKLTPDMDNIELINKSITQTLRRSIYTSLSTLFTLVCLYIFGVTAIRDFTLPIIIGIITGTYSSIALSATIWYLMLRKAEV